MANNPDIDNLLETPALRSGVYGLWLRVFLISVLEIRRGYGNTAAQAFLFDPENEFFAYVAECLGYEPDAMRERIRKTVKGGPGFGMAALPDQGPNMNSLKIKAPHRSFKRVIFSFWVRIFSEGLE